MCRHSSRFRIHRSGSIWRKDFLENFKPLKSKACTIFWLGVYNDDIWKVGSTAAFISYIQFLFNQVLFLPHSEEIGASQLINRKEHCCLCQVGLISRESSSGCLMPELIWVWSHQTLNLNVRKQDVQLHHQTSVCKQKSSFNPLLMARNSFWMQSLKAVNLFLGIRDGETGS